MEEKNNNEDILPVEQTVEAEEVEPEVQPTREMIERRRRLEELNLLRVTTQTEIPPERPTMSVDGVGIFERGDIGAIKAKQKAGKTTTLKTLAAAWMKGELFRLKSMLEEPRVLWIDTEQNLSDVLRIVVDVKRLSGEEDAYIDSHLKLYSLRSLSYKDLMDVTRLLASTYRPDVVVIDGLVDFVESFNDESLSHKLINELVVLCSTCDCALIAVLHENKSRDDKNMRGHLGTMLAQKSGIVISCEKDSSGVITVSCSDSRHAAMPTWKIRYDEFGHIVSADGPQSSATDMENARRENLMRGEIEGNGGSLTRAELTTKMMDVLKLSRPRVSNIISEKIKDGKFVENNGSIMLTQEQELFD